MPTLQTDDPNIIDAEAVNWRLIVYPILAVLVIGVGGLGYYYYLQNQRYDAETNARAALIQATTPEEFLKVADQYPGTDQATLATLRAADASFDKHDYQAALDTYRKLTENLALGPVWHDTAELGLASTHEAMGNIDRAISAFLEVARRGNASPYAPYAYNAAARIFEQRGDSGDELKILQEAAALDPDSTFTKQAQYQLKNIAAASQKPMTVPLPAAPAAPPPAPPAK